jgi:hypothetical protein
MCRSGGESIGCGSSNDFSECRTWEIQQKIRQIVRENNVPNPEGKFVFQRAERVYGHTGIHFELK